MNNLKTYDYMRTKILVLITLLFISGSVNAQIDRTKMPKPGPAPTIQLQVPGEFKMANGMTVLVVENKKLPRVSYNLNIDNVPSLDGDKAGITGILGAMLGNGTTTIAKDIFNEEVDFLGANINFGSSGGFASGLSKYSERLLELMADAAINPLLVEEEFNKEKEKQIEGLKANEKSVAAVAGRVESALVYGTHHPYGEFVTEATLNNITLDNVRAFYEKRFNPENAYLVVIGDIDARKVEDQIKEYFGNWKSKATTMTNVPKASPNVQFTQINFIDMPNAVQSNISVTNNVQLKMSDPDYHAALITNYILGGGGSAYLYSNLRETHGFTYGSYSRINANKYVSRFQAYAQVRNEVTDSSVVEIFNELKRIKTETVKPDVLAKAKASYTGRFVRALEQPQTIANYALNIKFNDLSKDYYTTYLQKINAVTAEDVKRVAQKYFLSDNARIVIVGKGSDVIANLEKTGIPIKYFDPYAKPVAKPEFSKPIPAGVTAQSVINNFIDAIGGKDKAMEISTVHSSASVAIEGVPMALSAELKQMAPFMDSIEMSAEGMGVLMKQKFNGETGYSEQQGMKKELSPEEIIERKKEHSIFPELYFDMANVSLESMTTIDGADVYKIKVISGDDESFRFYDANTGLLIRREVSAESQGQPVTSITDYSNYSPVKGVQFPYNIKIKSGPQNISMNISNVKVNEGVTAEDFN
jgi:predicted Zn-dependent peptidase